jgi:hydrophobe/amphiphile efflux-1 (HAE1) family protein
MLISNFAIHKPVITVVVMLAMVVFGTIALLLLQTDEFPQVEPPIVSVAIPYPGASPGTVETEVINPIEEVVAGISGVKQVQSTALDSFGTMVVEFEFEKDLQEATQDIRDTISQIRNDLPVEMEEPILRRFDPNDLPIVSFALTSERLDPAALTRLADPGITSQLRSIQGVAEVNVLGGLEREIEVQLRPADMAAAGVSVPEVVAALRQQNLEAPVGRLTTDFREDAIRLQGRLEGPVDFEQIVVKSSGSGSVRLGSVANVLDSTEERRTAAAFYGRPAVGIEVIKATGASTTSVSEGVIAAALALQLPEAVTLRVVRNSGERVEASVANVQAALVEGAALTVLVVFVFLNSWRSTVITGLTLPVSMLAAFIPVLAFGFTLNTMSLLGLTLAIGVLIDDAIVVRENIVRHLEMGKDHIRAAEEGTAEIGLAVTATTLTIVVVFVPIAFMGGLAEQWFAPFALTVAAAVTVSLFVSFSLDPMLSAYWADPPRKEEGKAWITRMLDRFNRWFERQADGYAGVIRWALDHRLAVVLVTIGSFVAAMALPMLGVVGAEFFPRTDDSEFTVALETPSESGIGYTLAKAEEISRVAREMPEVRYTYTSIGGQTEEVDEGNIFVRLTPKSERSVSQAEVAARLREQMGRMVGVTASITSGGAGGNQREIQLQLRGPDLDTLQRLADELRMMVEKVPGAVDVGLSTGGRRQELSVRVDRGLASNLGVSVADVANSLRPAFAGIDVGDWIDPTGETRDVRVRLSPEARGNAGDIERLPLFVPASPTPRRVPLGQVATIRRELGPAQIDHIDEDRVVSVQANTLGRPLSAVMEDINGQIAALSLPPGYTLTVGGDVEDQQEVFTRIFVALAVALLLMYFVLVIQFGSFVDPMAILISLPLSLIGVMLALLLTGSMLNLMSLIGVILLMGIVAKNAILLIDFAKWAEEKGQSRHEALIEAGRVRLRPILMTSLALVAGMIPVSMGGGEGAEFRAPMGRAIIGGVITSTLLTLLVIPTIYDIMSGARDRLAGWIGGRLRGHGGETPVREGGD